MKKVLIIFKDHRLLKFSFVLLTGYLLFDELLLFFSSKPTLTTQIQTSLQTKHFPEAVICSSPSYDQARLSSLGYEHSHDFSLGVIDGEHLRGWSGNQSDQTVGNILNQVSIIKTEDDCPSVKVKFQRKGKIIKSKLSLKLTRPVYPHGRCCQIKIPHPGPDYVLHQIYFRIYPSKYRNNKIKTFKMLLSDPENSSPFHQSQMIGESLETSKLTEDVGYHLYKIKVHEEVQLENNPNYMCRQYDSPGLYDSCLEAEYSRQSLALLGCTPPWLTEEELTWCRDPLNVSLDTSKRVNYFLENLSFGKADVGRCLSPCKTSWQLSLTGPDRAVTAVYAGTRSTISGSSPRVTGPG